MHPNAGFAWQDEAAMLQFVSEQAFAHIFTAADGALLVVHAPVLVNDGRIQFHVARRNRIAVHLADRETLISVSGRHAYQSANWYVSANQVPTWHYEAVEIEGSARPLSHEELVGHLDALSELHERRVQPEQPWTRAKMDGGKFDAMLNAITGFEVIPTRIRGTRKFNQHKSPDDLAATIAGQRGAGRQDIVGAIEEVRG